MPEERKAFKVSNIKPSAIPSQISVKTRWGKNFGRESGFAFSFPHGNRAAVFVDKRLKSGNYERMSALVGKSAEAARIITCEGNEWIVKTEPIGADQCGLTIHTAAGKAMMSGTCRIKKNGEMSFSVKTLHPSISNKKKTTGTVKGTGKSDGSWQIEASVSVEF